MNKLTTLLVSFLFCCSAIKAQKHDTIIPKFEEQAEFPGGLQAMMSYIKKNIHLPDSVYKRDLHGKVFLKFVINETGIISNVEVLKGISNCSACNEAAVSAVEHMPAWKPAKLDGRAVKCYFNLPISFKN